MAMRSGEVAMRDHACAVFCGPGLHDPNIDRFAARGGRYDQAYA